MDKTNDYNAFFYVTGTPYLLGFFSLFVLRCFKEKSIRKKTELQTEALHEGIESVVISST